MNNDTKIILDPKSMSIYDMSEIAGANGLIKDYDLRNTSCLISKQKRMFRANKELCKYYKPQLKGLNKIFSIVIRCCNIGDERYMEAYKTVEDVRNNLVEGLRNTFDIFVISEIIRPHIGWQKFDVSDEYGAKVAGDIYKMFDLKPNILKSEHLIQARIEKNKLKKWYYNKRNLYLDTKAEKLETRNALKLLKYILDGMNYLGKQDVVASKEDFIKLEYSFRILIDFAENNVKLFHTALLFAEGGDGDEEKEYHPGD